MNEQKQDAVGSTGVNREQTGSYSQRQSLWEWTGRRDSQAVLSPRSPVLFNVCCLHLLETVTVQQFRREQRRLTTWLWGLKAQGKGIWEGQELQKSLKNKTAYTKAGLSPTGESPLHPRAANSASRAASPNRRLHFYMQDLLSTSALKYQSDYIDSGGTANCDYVYTRKIPTVGSHWF